MKGWQNSNSIEKLKAKGMLVDYSDQPNNRSILVKENVELLQKVKRSNRHEESDLQINCVKTFGLMYPKLAKRLIFIPNDGERNNGKKYQDMGLCKGACDLVLLVPKNAKGALFIEVKAAKGRLSEYQVQFIKEMRDDYRCVIVRSVEQFLYEIKTYLHDT